MSTNIIPENKKEIRNLSNQIELRTIEDGESRNVDGYALLFGVKSQDLGGFKEILEPGCLDGVIEISDVLCPINHDPNRGILARSTNGNGSLQLSIDETGLKYQFEAPKTALGDELIEGLKRKDIRNSSFVFVVEKQRIERIGNEIIRYVEKIKELFDVSPVYNPAYVQTSVSLRDLEQALNETGNVKDELIKQDEENQRKQADKAKKHKIYMDSLKSKYLK